MSILSTHALSVSIADISVCRDLTLNIEPGQCWALLGKNGVGKTTLIHTLAGLHQAESGSIKLNEQDIRTLKRREIAQHIGVLFQHIDHVFPSSVLETVLIGRHPFLKPWEWENDADRKLAKDVLKKMGLENMEFRLTHTLSGGERRRVEMATLITQTPTIYLLDEPTNHLDLHHQIMLLDYLTQQAKEEGKALLMALHDLNLAVRYCQFATLLFGDGKHLSGPVDEMLTETNLQRVFDHPIRCMAAGNSNEKIYLPG